MKATVHELCSSMALILVSVSMFASMGMAHDHVPPPPPPPPPEGFHNVQMCWDSLQSVDDPMCAIDIFRSFFSGEIQPVGPACCKSFIAVEACWPEMFSFAPLFPHLLKSCCEVASACSIGGVAGVAPVASASSTTPPPTTKTDGGKLPFPGLLPPGGFTDVNKYWASLQSIEGCAAEIYRSFLTGKIQPLGTACCKAFVAVDEACWPKMFPFNPFFPPLIKSYCAVESTTTTVIA